MRAFVVGSGFAAVIACAAVSAIAFAQGSTWGAGAPLAAAADAGVAEDAGIGSVAASDGSAGDGAVAVDAGPPAVRAVTPIPEAPDAEAPDAESGPSDVGFSMGIHGGYAVPFGSANGSPLSYVLGGAVPVGLDVGWFFNTHLYAGVSLTYGFGVGAGNANSTCSDPDTTCSATLYHATALARWHFTPERSLDPWVGGGLGYELINVQGTNEADGSSAGSAALQAMDLTLEGGLDFKPLSYVGMGPYVALDTGYYLGGSTTALHEWLTFGLRLRTNL